MADKEKGAFNLFIKFAGQSAKMSHDALKQSETNSEMSVDGTAVTPGDKQPPSSQDCHQCDEVLINSNNMDSSGIADESKTSELVSSLLDPETKADTKDFNRMTKDDSGIDLLKSPAGERSSDDAERPPQDAESKHDKSLDVQDTVRINRPSTSNESEGVVADFVDPEEGEAMHADSTKSSSAMESNNSDEHDPFRCQPVDDPEPMANARPSLRPLADGHDSSDESDGRSTEDSEQCNRTRDTSTDKSDDDMDIDLDPPKENWNPLIELEHQQLGHSNRMPVAKIYKNKCGASIKLAQRLQLYTKLERHDGCVNALHFNEEGTLLASGSDDLNIVVWKWFEKKPFFQFESGHRSNVFQSKFMPFTGDTHIVSCARDGQVRLAELSSTGTCKGTKRLAQHKGAAHKLALLQDSSHVFYSCGEDAVMFEIDLRQEKPNKLSITKENTRKVPLYSIHANPFRSYEYCVSGRDQHIRVFDKRMTSGGDNSGLVKRYSPHHLQASPDNDLKANVTCAVYNYNGQEILGTYNDEDIYLFDNTHSDGADATHRYQGHRNNATVKGVNFYGPKSEFIITGSDCGNIFLWEKKTEKIVNFFQGDNAGVVNVLEPHPHGPIIATSGLDHDVKVWMPLAEKPTELDGLRRIVRCNKKEREEDRSDQSDAIDSTTFWRLMQHFHRAARRRHGEDTSSESDDSENDDEDEDDDSEREDAIQCVPS